MKFSVLVVSYDPSFSNHTPIEMSSISSNESTDPLTAGIVDLLKPAVEEIDRNVNNTRESQVLLREHIGKRT